MSLQKIKAQVKNNLFLIILFIAVSLIEVFAIFPLMFANCINYDSCYQYALTQHSFTEIWRLLPYDYSPPFYALALKAITLIFGNSLIKMRCFSIIAVIGMYFIAAFPIKRIFGRNAAIATLLITFLSPAIYDMLHEIRPTIFAMFFFMATAVYMLYAYSLEKTHAYVCTVIFSILAMYTHNIALVGVFGSYVAVLVFSLCTRNYKKFKKFLICGVICALAYVPWLTVLFKQMSNVREHYWRSELGSFDTLGWIFRDMLICRGNITLFEFIFPILLFFVILKHVKLKSIKGATKFNDVLTLADSKITYRDISLLFLFILTPFLILVLINNFFSNLASERYYYIIGTVWFVVVGVVIGRFGNKILAVLTIAVMGANLIYSINYTIMDMNESDIDQIVDDINEQNPNGNVAFLHLHEWTIGEMTYYFPNATHYVCDQTFTVLSTYDVFPANIVNIGDISNISDYTDDVYIFTNEWTINSEIPTYTFEQLMGDDENVTVTKLHQYQTTYNIATKQMDLAIAHFNKGQNIKATNSKGQNNQ
ncbi:glycosyltransferase family 39 protein [uncultured Ruminococcus sp.]|uniref:glycosyltransferase family 39 protein n=1 Tax=uncultured Ruminococcus sp. TaxID=165186 RepID=UPI0025E848FF|nr:glycosyltransferase family 39 protein [uncultured Ruminococcus sp.]